MLWWLDEWRRNKKKTIDWFFSICEASEKDSIVDSTPVHFCALRAFVQVAQKMSAWYVFRWKNLPKYFRLGQMQWQLFLLAAYALWSNHKSINHTMLIGILGKKWWWHPKEIVLLLLLDKFFFRSISGSAGSMFWETRQCNIGNIIDVGIHFFSVIWLRECRTLAYFPFHCNVCFSESTLSEFSEEIWVGMVLSDVG